MQKKMSYKIVYEMYVHASCIMNNANSQQKNHFFLFAVAYDTIKPY